ncbi:MAG: beta-galactosidase [Bryobacteraceae bacterium]
MINNLGTRLTFALLAGTSVLFSASSEGIDAAKDSSLLIDVSRTAAPPEALPFAVGGRAPDGHILSANSRYLLKDGAPWFPVMGEFHYARYRESGWEEEILKMKAGGVQIVSTYIFWIYHEETEGQFDWTAQRDLRRFIQLCAKHGMYVWIRVGPWAHGEVRNGGFPDWLLQRCPTRQSDPGYLRYVRRFYEQIGRQTKGLFWKDGGPIIGVQIENEYHERGPGQGPGHILTLLQIAREVGLDAPFYTVTGWDAAVVPRRQFLPVFGGYVDAFWSRSVHELPPNANYFFTSIRCDENVGDDLRSLRPDIDARLASYPFLTAEMGGGMEPSYHRRPVLTADDVAAMVFVKLGSGVTLCGYYMFHGGTNPNGRLTTLQESQATGYPNDLPVRSYDYQAPLGEFGQMNPSFPDLKMLHLFLHDFGSNLATMTAYFPDRMPAGKSDTATPRVAARFEGDHGFLFINNYQRNYPLPARRNFQVRLKTAAGEMKVPRHTTEIPSGAYVMWPVNLRLNGTVLQYSTAQLLCRLGVDTYVFFAWPGLPAEFAFDAAPDQAIEAPQARVEREDHRILVDRIEPGKQAAIRIRKAGGGEIQIILLSREMAREAWKANLAGHERLLLSAADLYFTSNAVHLSTVDPGELAFEIFPRPDATPAGFTTSASQGLFAQYRTHVKPEKVEARVEKLRDAGLDPPVRMGKEVAEAPEAEAFREAAEWSIQVPAVTSPSVRSAFLRLTYIGDVARVYAGSQLVTDDFYKGTPFEIALRPLSTPDADQTLKLQILPLRKDAPIYLPAGGNIPFAPSGQIVELQGVEVVPEYQATAELGK